VAKARVTAGNPRAEALAFVTAFVTLFAQILVHRMASLKLLNNLAFLVISLTMLGFALSGVALSRWLPAFLERRDAVLVTSASCYAVTLVVASWLFYGAGVPAAVASRAISEMPYWMLLSLLFAAPFAFCGLNLGLLLSSPDLPTRRIYAADLVGSALGAFAVIPAIARLGVETSIVLSAAGMVAATCLLAPPRSSRTRAAVAAAALVLAVAAARPEDVFRLHYREGSIHRSQHQGSGVQLEHVVWDPLARIEVSRIPPPEPEGSMFPSLIGENRRFLARFRRIITQNDNAFTYAVDYDGSRDSLTGIEETIYSAAYQARSVQRPRVLVIGVGGGFDILTALAFDASDVTGIDVNRATLGIVTRTYASYFRAWVQDPRVKLVAAEGRHYLTATDARFDVLQLSGVDSYSGTPGAANVFSESYLYTLEAFRLYLEHLSENGILNVMRLEFSPPREMLRALISAVAALRGAGVEQPERHIVMLTQNNGAFTALLVKKTPFRPEELQRLLDWASHGRFLQVSAAPGANTARANMYQAFLSLADPVREAAFVRVYPYEVSPAEDDRPFFFKYSRWSHLWADRAGLRLAFPTMEWSIVLLLVATSLVGALGVLLPLRFFAARGLAVPGASRHLLFFAGTGIGYLAIEVALLQKFGLLLGHPNYALSVVLATLLLATGLGALSSSRIAARLGGLRFVVYVLAALMLALYFFLFPRLTDYVGLPFAVRLLIVLAAVGPLGLLLGTFVPVALDHLKESAAALVPWAWGVNGIASVMAPVLAAAFSMTWGIGALFLSAIPLYLVVALVAPVPARAGTPSAAG
jgi:predicted membrane-bound spermidine synthase